MKYNGVFAGDFYYPNFLFHDWERVAVNYSLIAYVYTWRTKLVRAFRERPHFASSFLSFSPFFSFLFVAVFRIEIPSRRRREYKGEYLINVPPRVPLPPDRSPAKAMNANGFFTVERVLSLRARDCTCVPRIGRIWYRGRSVCTVSAARIEIDPGTMRPNGTRSRSESARLRRDVCA